MHFSLGKIGLLLRCLPRLLVKFAATWALNFWQPCQIPLLTLLLVSREGLTCICACLLGRFFAKFGIAIKGFHQKTREGAQIDINRVYFGQIIVKSTQFGQNWVLFFKNGILMGGKLGKKLV